MLTPTTCIMGLLALLAVLQDAHQVGLQAVLVRLNAQAASHGLHSGHCTICRQQLRCLKGVLVCILL